LAKVFRAKFIKEVRQSGVLIDQTTARQCFAKPWVVYAKAPFLGPRQVIEYLGRYTHKIAISNHRIKAIEDGHVHFKWKDYRTGKLKVMKLAAVEFLRRFCQHIIPSGFVRIRHYGILASRNKTTKLNQAKLFFRLTPWQKPQISDWKQVAQERMGINPDQCPHCKQGTLRLVEILDPLRGPPQFDPLTRTPN
jgi:hypothetical protein